MGQSKGLGFSSDEIERRKVHIRRLWAGKPVDHLPVQLVVTDPNCPYGIAEQQRDGDKQLEAAMRCAALSWEMVPEGDYIPAMRPDVGCSCLSTAFGAKTYWSDDPNQTCGIEAPVLKDAAEAHTLAVPPPDAGDLAEGIRRVRQFAEAGEGLVAVSLLDMAGGLNVAMDLLGGDALNLAMLEQPEDVLCLLGKIQDLFIATIEAQGEAAGGEENIATLDFPDYWYPEGRKGHVSDDVSAMISPGLYRTFSLPAHNRIFQRFGGGGLHNCGPNPCLAQYLEHTPPPRAIDLAYAYSQGDLPRIKEVCRKRALIYMGDFPGGPGDALAAYRGMMELLAPDVAAVPVVFVRADDEPAAWYKRFRAISEEWAKRMDWGWVDEDG